MRKSIAKMIARCLFVLPIFTLPACSNSFQDKPSLEFVQNTKPIIYELAGVLNEVLSLDMDTHTYGETTEACEKNLKLLTEIRKRLLAVTPKNKKDNEMFTGLHEMMLNLEKIWELNKKANQYGIDNLGNKQQIELSQANGGDVTKLTEGYTEKQSAIESIKTEKLPQLWAVFSARSMPLFKNYETVYEYDVKSIIPVIPRYEELQKESKKKLKEELQRPLDLPMEQGETPLIEYLTDSIKAMSLVNQARADKQVTMSDDKSENYIFQTKQSLRLYRSASDMLKRSDFSKRVLSSSEDVLTDPEKAARMYLMNTSDVLKLLIDSIESMLHRAEKIIATDITDAKGLKNAKKEFEKLDADMKAEEEKISKIWTSYFYAQLFFPFTYLRIDETNDSLALALDDKQTEQILALIRAEFGSEIMTFNDEVVNSPSLIYSKPHPYVGVLMIYEHIQEFHLTRKYESSKADWSQLDWGQIKGFGIYRAADNVGKYAIRESYYKFKAKRSKDESKNDSGNIANDEAEKLEAQEKAEVSAFYDTHPL